MTYLLNKVGFPDVPRNETELVLRLVNYLKAASPKSPFFRLHEHASGPTKPWASPLVVQVLRDLIDENPSGMGDLFTGYLNDLSSFAQEIVRTCRRNGLWSQTNSSVSLSNASKGGELE